jgi:hypothetical protein
MLAARRREIDVVVVAPRSQSGPLRTYASTHKRAGRLALFGLQGLLRVPCRTRKLASLGSFSYPMRADVVFDPSPTQPETRLNWDRMRHLTERWLPPARILHPWPEQRFAVLIQGKSRMH